MLSLIPLDFPYRKYILIMLSFRYLIANKLDHTAIPKNGCGQFDPLPVHNDGPTFLTAKIDEMVLSDLKKI